MYDKNLVDSIKINIYLSGRHLLDVLTFQAQKELRGFFLLLQIDVNFIALFSMIFLKILNGNHLMECCIQTQENWRKMGVNDVRGE